MTSADRKEWLSFAREVAKVVPHVLLQRTAERLIEKYAKDRKPLPQRKVEKKEKRLSRKVFRAEVRAACVVRAGPLCECGCGGAFGIGDSTPEWDEFYGRTRVSVSETWMLKRACHRAKTENSPSRAYWDSLFAAFCGRNDYRFTPRFTKDIRRGAA